MTKNLAQTVDEMAMLIDRHASTAAKYCVAFGSAVFDAWKAAAYRQNGHRAAAAVLYARSAVERGQLRDCLRAAGVARWERAILVARRVA